MSLLWTVLFLSGALGPAFSMVMPGLCPTQLKAIEDFDHERFMGTWYEVQRTPFLMETMIRCNKFHYQEKGDSEEGIIVYMKGNRQSVSTMLSTTSSEDFFSLRSASESAPILGFGLTRIHQRTRRSFANYAALNETLRRTEVAQRRTKDKKAFKEDSDEYVDDLDEFTRRRQRRNRRKNKEMKIKHDNDNDVDDGDKKKRKDYENDNSNDYQPISKPKKTRGKYNKTNQIEEKKETSKKRKQSSKQSFGHKKKKQQPLESNADDNGAQDSDKNKDDNPPKPSVTNVAKGIVQTVQKFGSDISDATGQLLNNVNSMSPTIETWTKRGQELAEQIRGEGFSIEGEILTNAQGPYSLHMKTPSFEYKSPAYVIDTDYKNYAVIWACQNNLINGFMRRENIWVLSRNKSLDSTIRRALHERLRSKTYAAYFLMPTDQTHCK